MMLDLSSVINCEGRTLDVQLELDLAAPDGNACIIKPVQVLGKVTNIGGSLEFSATAKTVFTFLCDRCLVPIEKDFSCEMEEVFKKKDQWDGEGENPDVVYFQGSAVDIDEVVLNNILLSLPSKILCSEGCRGLCPECGKNLNEGECGCDTRPSDPRFDVLDKFFE